MTHAITLTVCFCDSPPAAVPIAQVDAWADAAEAAAELRSDGWRSARQNALEQGGVDSQVPEEAQSGQEMGRRGVSATLLSPQLERSDASADPAGAERVLADVAGSGRPDPNASAASGGAVSVALTLGVAVDATDPRTGASTSTSMHTVPHN